MKATGITAEFNPLHNGHAYVMDEARRITGCDAVAVAMSGDYVQRGEPAVCDKWTRAETALRCGADLVVEIPTLFCLGNASQYANAGVSILEALGCDHIAFGSESGDTELIRKTAACLKDRQEVISKGISAKISEGMSYPAARETVYRDLRLSEGATDEQTGYELELLRNPNDILALEYLMSMSAAEPVAIRRGDFTGASEIRTALESGKADEIRSCVPDQTIVMLEAEHLTFPDEWTDVLRYAVMSADPEEIEDCPSGGEGLGNLLSKAVRDNDSWDGIIKTVKSKRYTYTRISRLCMQVILGITRSTYPAASVPYIRILGFNTRGRQLLSEIKSEGKCSLQVITNINKEAGVLTEEASGLLDLDMHAAYIYNLITGRDVSAGSDHRKMPVII